MFNKSNPLRYMTNGSKNPKNDFCCIFTPLLGSRIFSHGVEQFDSIFLGIAWVDERHNYEEKNYFPENGPHKNRNRKKHFFSYSSYSCLQERMLLQKHESYRCEPALKKLNLIG